jgi:hypothetical protein
MKSSKVNLLWVISWMLLSSLAAELLVFMPVYLLGLLVFWPLLWLCPRVQLESHVNAGEMVTAFKWTWVDELWGNFEDGLLPAWWAQKGGSMWTWYLRNPVCNMRFWPIVSTLPARSVRYVGTVANVPSDGVPGWFIAWQGGYAGVLWQCKRWGIWWGWKVNPRDAQVDAPHDYRYSGLGLAAQLMRF